MTMLAPTPADQAEGDAAPAARSRYFNRELSWLAFNRRVLAEAENEAYPLLERLRFLSISGSNLDEFTMIRIAGLEGQARRGIETTSIDGRTPTQQLEAIGVEVRALEARQQETLARLRAMLRAEGIAILAEGELDEDAHEWCRKYFLSAIMPLVTPQAVDPSHPFPFVANAGIGLVLKLRRPSDGEKLVEMVLIPANVPRFVRVPGPTVTYVPIEALVCRFAHELFPGFDIEGDGVFRVLRDSDIELEEEAEDLVRFYRSAIQRRRRGRVVHLELDDECDVEAARLLRENLGADTAMVAETSGMLAIADLAEVCAEDRQDLKFAPFSPRYPERILAHDGDCFAAIREKDIIVQHPYESFEVVVDFLRQAARDPAVVSIKQTLYRAGDQSPVIVSRRSRAGWARSPRSASRTEGSQKPPAPR